MWLGDNLGDLCHISRKKFPPLVRKPLKKFVQLLISTRNLFLEILMVFSKLKGIQDAAVSPAFKPALLSVVVSLGLTACSDNGPASVDNTQLRALAAASDVIGDPVRDRTLPSIDEDKAQLGKLLFFTKGLGGDSDSACVTCHHPMLGGGDDLALSIGAGAETPDLLGPGRIHTAAGGDPHFDGGPPVPRNAPTTFNMGLWDRVLFLDGRVENLDEPPRNNGAGANIRTPDSAFGVADANAGANLTAAQARFPVTSEEEMEAFTVNETPGDHGGDAALANQTTRGNLEAKLAGDWDAEFTAAGYTIPFSYDDIAEALSEYERSQVFVENPWNEFLAGDDTAISESAKRGAMLFLDTIDNGGANCVSCHSGDFFTDENFHVVAMPQLGRGKGDGDDGTDDFGRARETGVDMDKYKFRTPTLLNVASTGPFGHAGGYATLEATVRHHLNPADAIANYDFDQLDDTVQAQNMLTNTEKALQQLETHRGANVPNVLQDVELTDTEVADLVAFLEALTDPCVENRECMARWLIADSDADPDGLQLDAVDVDNNPL